MRRSFIVLAILLSAGLTTLYAYTHQPVDRIPDDLRSDEEITFYALGDQGSGGIKQWQVSRAMEKLAEKQRDLDFLVLMGDNFYVDKPLTLDSPEWRTRFEQVYAGKFLNAVPFYAVLGNHDYGKADGSGDEDSPGKNRRIKARQNPEVQLEYSNRHLGSNRWRMPARYYSADFGMVQGRPLLRVVFLDTNLAHEELLKEADFVRKAFSAGPGGAVWKIAVGHHPFRTYGKHFGEVHDIEETLLPALRDAQVDLYLAGHDHNQQVIARDGEPVLVVSGGGGDRIYKIGRQSPDLVFSRSTHGFAGIYADRAALKLGLYDIDGTAMAAYKIDRTCAKGQAACLQAAPQKKDPRPGRSDPARAPEDG